MGESSRSMAAAVTIFALGGALLSVLAWDQARAAEQQDLAAAGRALVEEKCARCHATGLGDESPHESAPPFRDVVELYPSENLAEALAEGIVSGHPDMPVFVFETADIEVFLAYLNELAEQADAAR